MTGSRHSFEKIILSYPQFFAVAAIVLCLFILVFVLYLTHLKIKNQKYLTELARQEQERYRVAAELSNDILFEYNVKPDKMEYSEKYREIFGRKPSLDQFTELMEEKAYIHPEDAGLFELFCRHLHQGKQTVEIEYRALNADEEYVWCHIQGKTLYDGKNRPQRVIGRLVNIDVQKKELERLQRKAQLDPFTNVYNKMVTGEKVEQKLHTGRSRQDKHALLVIDIDNFKSINDQKGHQMGDLVIERLVGLLKQMFREDDIIGRVGGDEFVVFMTNISSQEDVENKVRYVQKSLREHFHKSVPQLDSEITLSIGISFSPRDGDSYDSLFKKADQALYHVKKLGKGSYCVYHQDEIEENQV